MQLTILLSFLLLLVSPLHNSNLYFPNRFYNFFICFSCCFIFLLMALNRSHIKSCLERGRVRICLNQRMTIIWRESPERLQTMPDFFDIEDVIHASLCSWGVCCQPKRSLGGPWTFTEIWRPQDVNGPTLHYTYSSTLSVLLQAKWAHFHCFVSPRSRPFLDFI